MLMQGWVGGGVREGPGIGGMETSMEGQGTCRTRPWDGGKNETMPPGKQSEDESLREKAEAQTTTRQETLTGSGSRWRCCLAWACDEHADESHCRSLVSEDQRRR